MSKYQEGELLDERSTKKIFELGQQQMLEIEQDEEKEFEAKRRRNRGSANADSSDEEDNGSTMGDILDDEEEE